MTDQIKNDTTKPEVEVQAQPPAAKEAEPENIQEINWRNFRANREKERKEKEDALRRARESEEQAAALTAALAAAVNKPQHASQESADESEEDRIARQVAKALQKQAEADEKKRQERERAEMPNKLATVYNDFSKVCTEDNIDYLEYHYPEVAEAYKHMPDSFDKWSSVYKAIKRFVPNNDSKKDQAKAEKNFNKPQAISKPGSTPTGDTAPIYLDDKRRQDNWKRMQRVMKGV